MDSANNEKLIAFVVYPGLTLLDLVGPLQTLLGLRPDYVTVTVGERIEAMPTDTRLRITPESTFAEVPRPFGIVVPGGSEGTLRAMADPAVQGYLRSASQSAEVVASVCTGALVLAAAGLLEGGPATTHWAYKDILTSLGSPYQRARWVENGKCITAAGVSAGIDMAIHLAGRLVGEDRARQIQAGIEYDPQPPFGPMDWSKATTSVMASFGGDEARQRNYFADVWAGRDDLIAKVLP
jgi:transcriptional regulator GlxA family with amidase domain